MNPYKQRNWELDLPALWVCEFDDNIHTFFSPESYGVLQISEYSKDTEIITNEDLFDLIELEDEAIKHLKEITIDNFRGFQLRFSEDDTFWTNWWLIKKNILLFITYNCELIDKDKESDVIDNILKTIK